MGGYPDANALAVQGLTFTYKKGTTPALKDISFTLRHGRCLGILGHSGAGKSTLCQCLNGLIPHLVPGNFTGTVRVLGQDTHLSPPRKLVPSVGLVLQDFENQLFSTSLELEVAFGPENLALPKQEIASRVSDAIAQCGLTGLEDRPPHALSGGQKQRLAIASVLALQPQILCLDEPLTDLDAQGRNAVSNLISRLRSQADRTFVMADTQADHVATADEVLLLKDGELQASGPAREVLTDADALIRCGVRPAQIVELSARLRLTPPAFTVAEALHRLSPSPSPPPHLGVPPHFPPVESSLAPPPSPQPSTLNSKPSTAGDEPAVLVADVSFTHPGNVLALDGAGLRIDHGDFVAIIGPNGSGKSTLIKHFNGLLRPQAGRVFVFGHDTSRTTVRTLSRYVGIVFQNPDHQLFAGRVYDDVAFGPRLHGVDEKTIDTLVQESLQAVHLQAREDADPFALTKSERQRVALAAALAARPQILILDEPTTGLDYNEVRQAMDLLATLNAAGHTIIIVTHHMWVVAEYASRVVAMSNGRIVLDAPVREAMKQEDQLRQLYCEPPEICQLANRLGISALSVAELAAALSTGNSSSP